MNTQIIKSTLPTLVKNFSQFFELDLTIKLFGVTIFKFHWPPKDDNEVEPSNPFEK